jgi:exodeoxyribonuclease VII large subunit
VTTVTAPQVVIPATAGATTPENPWPVRLLTSKMTEYIAKAPAVWLEGQVVQLTRRPGQGTVYLTLRDTDVDLSFSVTVAARVLDGLAAPLADGAHVVVHARPQLFPRRGSLSLAADDLRPVGVGELLARLEHLRRVLAAEGLFAADRKKPLPFLPRVVGLVCGRASAAERDVVENARRRWPGVRFDIRAVAVQGPNCVPEVIDAIEALDREAEVDVIVVARGGGSLEDLLPFSNEAMVRAVAACRTPVVSAIGHEVDAPLVDLAADVRASTPTDAAKRVVPDVGEELARVAQARALARRSLQARLDREERLLADLRTRPALADPARVLAAHAEQLHGLRARARSCVLARLHRADDDVVHLRERVAALSPAATLARGYAVVQDGAGAVVRSPDAVEPGDRLRIRVHGGELAAVTVSGEDA